MYRIYRLIALAFALSTMLPLAAHSQDYLPPPDAMPAPQGAPPANAPPPTYSQQQIDQMVAPIALYPDQLVSQVLMASTYPLEVVEASRWLKDPNNAQLNGDQLAQALEPQPWDPSVKSLVPFPQVLSMMDSNLQWTEQLGDAFLGQQGAVMDSVQHLRQMAQASGNLNSTPQQVVSADQGEIVIQPAEPQVVYVPVYNPTVVYGAWPWAGYPPYYFPPPPNYYYASSGIIGFGIGITVASILWDWDRWDWHHHRIDIDDSRFEEINRGHAPHVSGQWEHNPAHRHGVPYASPAVRQEFQHVSDQDRRNSRGFEPRAGIPNRQGSAAVAPSNANPQIQGIERQQQLQRERQPQLNPQTQAVERQQQIRQEHFRVAPQTQQQQQQQIQQPQRQQINQQRIIQLHAQPASQAQRRAPVFESFSRGPDVRAQSQRGSFSRASAPSIPAAAHAPAVARSAPAVAAPHGNGGGQQRGGGGNNDRHDDNARGR